MRITPASYYRMQILLSAGKLKYKLVKLYGIILKSKHLIMSTCVMFREKQMYSHPSQINLILYYQDIGPEPGYNDP